MEPKQHILPIPELEQMIFSHLDSMRDYRKLALINHHFNETINKIPFYIEFKEFFLNRKLNFRDSFILQRMPSTEMDLKIFLKACQFGYYYIVKFILDKKQIDTNAYSDYGFQLACKGGNFEIVKLLYNSNHRIKIYENEDLAFVWSCSYGHLEIAKFLFEIDNNIMTRIKSNIYYRIEVWTGSQSHINKWLASICDYYELLPNNELKLKLKTTQ